MKVSDFFGVAVMMVLLLMVVSGTVGGTFGYINGRTQMCIQVCETRDAYGALRGNECVCYAEVHDE